MKSIDYLLPASVPMPIQLTVIFSVLLFISACTKNQQPPPAPPAAVTVATAIKQSIKPTIEFIGRAESTDDIKIRSRVGGVLVKRFFKEGQDINKGDRLFEIDQAPFKTALFEQKAKFDKATANYSIAKRNFDRGEKLIKTNVISELDMDKLANQLEATKSGINQAQAGVDAAELNLGYTVIRAPLEGRVGKSLFAIGDVINPAADTLTTLVKMDPMRVSFQVNEKAMVTVAQEVSKRKQAKPDAAEEVYVVELRLSNGTLYSEQGIIDYLGNRIDAATGTMNLRALFNNPNNILLPGQYMDVILMSDKEVTAILIPQTAVQEDQQGRFVMTVGVGDKVARTRVKMGERYGVDWEVISGLNVGSRVVVEGLQKVRSGIKVSATEQEIKPFESSPQTSAKVSDKK